jgi:hypothetical protein
MAINTSSIEELYQNKHQQLESAYLDILARIDQVETESLLLADSVFEKSSVRGPRQTDESYGKKLTLAIERRVKISNKIANKFNSLREGVEKDRITKTARVERSHNEITGRAERDYVRNDKKSVTIATEEFKSEISNIKMAES